MFGLLIIYLSLSFLIVISSSFEMRVVFACKFSDFVASLR